MNDGTDFHENRDGGGLTVRQARFCRAYLYAPTAAEAARAAGYGDSGARAQAWRLLQDSRVRARIEALRRDRALAGPHHEHELLAKLERVYESAIHSGQFRAAVQAVEAQSRLLARADLTRDGTTESIPELAEASAAEFEAVGEPEDGICTTEADPRALRPEAAADPAESTASTASMSAGAASGESRRRSPTNVDGGERCRRDDAPADTASADAPPAGRAASAAPGSPSPGRSGPAPSTASTSDTSAVPRKTESSRHSTTNVDEGERSRRIDAPSLGPSGRRR